MPGLSLKEVKDLYGDAQTWLEGHHREGGYTETSASHTDAWGENGLPYVVAALLRGNRQAAMDELSVLLDAATPGGRLPHMILDSTSVRRKVLDRHIHKAERLPDGTLVSPLVSPPIASLAAREIALSFNGPKRQEWAVSVLPRLIAATEWRYANRDIFDDGLPVQISPDEMLLRSGSVAARALAALPESKLTKLETKVRNVKSAQGVAERFRVWQAKDHSDPRGTVEVADLMQLSTAARMYTLWNTLRRNDHNAKLLSESVNKHGEPDGFLMQDVAIDALLIADNQALVELANLAGAQLPEELVGSMQKTRQSFGLHWSEELGRFCSRNPKTGELYDTTGAESFVALLASGPSGSTIETNQWIQTLMSANLPGWNTNFAIPTGFIPENLPQASRFLDRGAMSPSINALVTIGLREIVEVPAADKLRQRLDWAVLYAVGGTALKNEVSFARQFSSDTGDPIAQGHWGPTASAVAQSASRVLG